MGPGYMPLLRRALIVSHGDPTVFVTRPISLTLLILAAILLLLVILPAVRRTRAQAFTEA
jgi:putative tricarboxylic transport membrane protein